MPEKQDNPPNSMETPPRATAPLDAYLRRYERQQQERRRERLQRRAQVPEAADEDLSGFLSDVRQEMEGRRESDALSERYNGFARDQDGGYARWSDGGAGGHDDLGLSPLANPFRSAGQGYGGSPNAQQHAEDEFVDAGDCCGVVYVSNTSLVV
jgi:hypothetical protein